MTALTFFLRFVFHESTEHKGYCDIIDQHHNRQHARTTTSPVNMRDLRSYIRSHFKHNPPQDGEVHKSMLKTKPILDWLRGNIGAKSYVSSETVGRFLGTLNITPDYFEQKMAYDDLINKIMKLTRDGIHNVPRPRRMDAGNSAHSWFNQLPIHEQERQRGIGVRPYRHRNQSTTGYQRHNHSQNIYQGTSNTKQTKSLVYDLEVTNAFNKNSLTDNTERKPSPPSKVHSDSTESLVSVKCKRTSEGHFVTIDTAVTARNSIKGNDEPMNQTDLNIFSTKETTLTKRPVGISTDKVLISKRVPSPEIMNTIPTDNVSSTISEKLKENSSKDMQMSNELMDDTAQKLPSGEGIPNLSLIPVGKHQTANFLNSEVIREEIEKAQLQMDRFDTKTNWSQIILGQLSTLGLTNYLDGLPKSYKTKQTSHHVMKEEYD